MGYKIGILGSGDVARSLATGFLRHRHEVAVGSRTPGAVTWAHELGIRAQTHAETAAWGEILVLAVAGRAACEVLEMAGVTTILGKIVIDVTNRCDLYGQIFLLLRRRLHRRLMTTANTVGSTG